jgi:hypothetical protein
MKTSQELWDYFSLNQEKPFKLMEAEVKIPENTLRNMFIYWVADTRYFFDKMFENLNQKK